MLIFFIFNADSLGVFFVILYKIMNDNNLAPATGLSFFIIAFGGLGGLRQNQDWDGDKGTLLVGSTTDNLGIKFPVGSNDQVLTVNLTKDSGLEWKAIPTQTASVPSGSVMLFYNATAPTGWTRDDTHNDKALRVVSGSSTGGSFGPTTNGIGFTNAFTSRTPTGKNTNGDVQGHALTRNQLPDHAHSLGNAWKFVAGGGGDWALGSSSGSVAATPNSGGIAAVEGGFGQSHDHGFTNPTFTGDAMNFAVNYINLILCKKD